MKKSKHFIIVGGGLSGLSAAIEIERLGGTALLVEGTNSLGGRVQTDNVKGFLLDRGFQVLLSSYEEVNSLDILRELHGKAFISGALCHSKQGWIPFYNPLRHPFHVLKAPMDYIRLFSMVYLSSSKEGESTCAAMTRYKISNRTKIFLEAFFSGVFLDTELKTDSHLFKRYMKHFITGRALLPEGGMGAFPHSLAGRLKETEILLNAKVVSISKEEVNLEDGRKIKGEGVILAVDQPSLARLLPNKYSPRGSCSVTTLYFSIQAGCIDAKPILYLGMSGPINSVCFPNKVQPSYAPDGYDLICVTVIDEVENIEQIARQTLATWFSIDAGELELLKIYRIQHALPFQTNLPKEQENPIIEGMEGVFLASEEAFPASIDGALTGGKLAAMAAML